MDQNLLERFKQRAGEKTRLAPDEVNPARMILLIGSEDVPFAVPHKGPMLRARPELPSFRA
jgi:hypothetical protein